MDNFNQEHIKFHAKIQAIQNSKNLSEQQKIHQISLLKAAQGQATDTSGKTIWGITNCMIGSAMIVYPVLFAKSGIIISPIIMIMVAIIQYLTCRLLVLHNRQDQSTYNQSILRIGGIKIDKINSIVNMLLFFFVCVAYFILISHNFYQISSAIIQSFLHSYHAPGSHQIIFNKYSLQWAAIITIFALKSIVFQKNIDSLLKLAKYSLYCVMSYAVFILLNLLRHLIEGNIHLGEFRLFNTDFSSVAGAFALSFLVHPMAAPILKKNINLLNNNRDLFLGYSLGATICFYVGFFGALSCGHEVSNILAAPQKYSTIFDCVSSTSLAADDRFFYILSKIVQCAILFQNFTVMPIMLFLTRTQFINLLYIANNNNAKKRQQIFTIFTWIFLIFSLIITLAAIDVSIILSMDGAIIGFFVAYGIPIYIHFKCLFYQFSDYQNKRRKSLMESLLNQSILGQNQHQLELVSQALQCNKHQNVNKMQTYFIYGAILLCGIALGFFKLSAVFG